MSRKHVSGPLPPTVLGMGPRTLCIPGRCSALELHPTLASPRSVLFKIVFVSGKSPLRDEGVNLVPRVWALVTSCVTSAFVSSAVEAGLKYSRGDRAAGSYAINIAFPTMLAFQCVSQKCALSGLNICLFLGITALSGVMWA